MKLTGTFVRSMAIVGLLACGLPSHAQTNTNHPGAAVRPGARGAIDNQLARLSEQLKLTDEQKPKVKSILEERVKKLQELRTEGAVTPEQRRAKVLAIQGEENKKMKEVLTADQYKTWEQRQDQRGRRGPPRMEGGTNTNRGGRPGGTR